MLDEVRAQGQSVHDLLAGQSDVVIGYWAGIATDPKTGMVRASRTAESPNTAGGY